MIKAITVNSKRTIGVPKKWVRASKPGYEHPAYDTLSDEDHFLDGWKEVITPEFNSETHKTGELQEYEDRFEYDVDPLTQQEIDANYLAKQEDLIATSEANRQSIIDETIRKQNEDTVNAEFQAIDDDDELLNNMDAFPFWQADTWYTLGLKIKRVVNLDLKLYKINQDHTSLDIYPPEATGVQALYTEVAPLGVIPVFVQPTGAHDAYQIGDQLHFPTESDPVYESLINANTYSPSAYPAGWQLIN
jgi:hypothetical protein